MKNIKGKKGAKLSGGLAIVLVVAVIFVYTQGWFDFILQPTPPITPPITPVSKCPSSGLTEVTLNTQEALASTATNAEVDYYAYDNGVLVKSGSTTTGTVSFDLECGVNKKYTMLVLNETILHGFYPQTVTIDATTSQDVHNLKMYQYGEVNIANVGSSTDPTGDDNISVGTGKNCGFTVTFSNNESASGYNKPIIMCMVNVSAVTDVSMDDLTEVASKRPIRLSAITNHQYYAFEYSEMLKSTDAAVKVSGKIKFSDSMGISSGVTNNMSCIVIDQATFKVAEYKTLSLSEGFLESAENTETLDDIGAPDSLLKTLEFAGTYC